MFKNGLLNSILRKDINYFFIALLCFAVALPLSEALVSVFGGIVLLVALIEDHSQNKWIRLKKNRILLLIGAVYGIYLIWSLFSFPFANSFYDLRKNMFFLVLPLAFALGKPISSRQKQMVFWVFSGSVLLASLIALGRWCSLPAKGPFEVHKISLISHIRFSFQLILAFWFFILLIRRNFSQLKIQARLIFGSVAFFLAGFLFFQQSLTGLVAFITTSLFFVFYLAFQNRKIIRVALITSSLLVILIPVGYVSWVVVQFYDIEKVDPKTVDLYTNGGNRYLHDFNNPMVENGQYVWLYVCDKELKNAWEKRSALRFDAATGNGYPLRATLLRYLTSKGLRKDAEGVMALTREDIRNIENGIANVIYHEKKFSFYPRIYQTVWEYYVYSKTGYVNNQSFSQRIEFAKAAITIIKQHPWFGVGTARWKEAYENAYAANHSKLDPAHYASAHNQYLNYLVKFGVSGFIIILFLLTFPVIITRRYRDVYFMIFLVSMFFVNFADSNFETHMGSSFFVFFYCLFLRPGGDRYLRLSY